MNTAEINRTFVEYITYITTGPVLDGLEHIYKECVRAGREARQAKSKDNRIKAKTTNELIIECLKEVPNFNKSRVEREAERVKIAGQCYDWYDDLLNATIKSYTILLSCNKMKKPTRVSSDLFIHRVYINCSKILLRNPSIITNAFNSGQLETLQTKIMESIRAAIRDSLQTKKILHNYIKYGGVADKVSNFREEVNEIRIVGNDDENPNSCGPNSYNGWLGGKEEKNKATRKELSKEIRNKESKETRDKENREENKEESNRTDSKPMSKEENKENKEESKESMSKENKEESKSMSKENKEQNKESTWGEQNKESTWGEQNKESTRREKNKQSIRRRGVTQSEGPNPRGIFVRKDRGTRTEGLTEEYGKTEFEDLIGSLRRNKGKNDLSGPIVSSDFLK